MKRCLAALLLSTISQNAASTEVEGIKLPTAAKFGDTTLTLNGAGVRTKTFLEIKVYALGLYPEAPARSPPAIVDADLAWRLEFRFTHDAPRERLHCAPGSEVTIGPGRPATHFTFEADGRPE